MSKIKYLTSNILHQISIIKYPTSNINNQISYLFRLAEVGDLASLNCGLITEHKSKIPAYEFA